MNILQLSYADNGGCSYFQSDTINRCTDHTVRFIRMKQNYLDYPQDIQAPDKETIRHWYDWADVLHIHDNAHHICEPDWPLKPAVMQYHGSHYRASPFACQVHCDERAWPIGVSTIDLTLFGDAVWLPNAREDMSHLRQWDERPDKITVAHCPTQRGAKGTDAFLPDMRQMETDGEIDFMLVEKVSIGECCKLKGYAHLLIDQFLLGYGSNAIESWAIGMPVIGDASNNAPEAYRLRGLDTKEVLAEMKRIIGYLPFCKTPLEELVDTILRFRHDREFWQHWRDVGRQYWHDWHRQEAVADILVPLYEQAIEQSDQAQRDTLGRYGGRDGRKGRRRRSVFYAKERQRNVDTSEMVLMRYRGRNAGTTRWIPDGVIGRYYEFDSVHPVRYVFKQDAAWFLGLEDKGKQLFELEKGSESNE